MIYKILLLVIIKKTKRNKVFADGTIDGYTVAAIDGTKLFESYKKCCEECCKTTVVNERYVTIIV